MTTSLQLSYGGKFSGTSFQNMADSTIRSDPISGRYFGGVEHADQVSIRLFFSIALLSIVVLFTDRAAYPLIYHALELTFAILVIVLFVIGLANRLYLTPRAEDKRRQDFFSNACRVPLVHEATVGYYNNELTEPITRIAAQLLENSLFSKNIAREMARRERILIAMYIFIYLGMVFNRGTELEIITVVSQVIFSEQVLSRYVRLEWLRMRFEQTFEKVYRIFQSKPDEASFRALILDSLVNYETSKATAGITLSSGLFNKSNPALTQEWKCIKKKLNI